MGEAKEAAKDAGDSTALHLGARLGLAARGTVWLAIGVLAGDMALDGRKGETDQHGAIEAIAHQSGGRLLLVVLAIGMAGYALWRLTEAAFGTADGKDGAWPRVKSAWRAVVYALLAGSTLKVVMGSGQKSRAKHNQELSARVMEHSGGRFLVAAVGIAVLVGGVGMAVGALREKFMKHMQSGAMSARTRAVVAKLGLVGTLARGVVFALAGWLLIDAAWRFDPHKARGIDAALRTLAKQSHGRVLLLAVAAGLVVFGIYGYAEARWRRTGHAGS